ncbi:MAG: hypothetical protein ACHP65_10240, partial [Legionellales bacterium]
MSRPDVQDERKFKLNKRLLVRIYYLLRPFWARKAAWPFWVALAASFALISASAAFYGYLSYKTGELANLQLARDHAYWALLIWLTILTFMGQLIGLLSSLITTRIELSWRAWLSNYLTAYYMQDHAYYDIVHTADIDNPDQRIQEQVSEFCSSIMRMPEQIFGKSLNVAVQIGILLSISSTFLTASLFYLALSLLATYYFSIIYIKITWLQIVANANLRSALSLTRENAESIAFYRGEKRALDTITTQIATLFKRDKAILYLDAKVKSANVFIEIIPNLLPVLILVPLFFAGHIEYGIIVQGTAAAVLVIENFQGIYGFIPMLSNMVPIAGR